MKAKNETIAAIFQSMKKKGEKNIYLLSSKDIIGHDGEATVDGIHFTDLGFMRYAEVLYPLIKNIFGNFSILLFYETWQVLAIGFIDFFFYFVICSKRAGGLCQYDYWCFNFGRGRKVGAWVGKNLSGKLYSFRTCTVESGY